MPVTAAADSAAARREEPPGRAKYPPDTGDWELLDASEVAP